MNSLKQLFTLLFIFTLVSYSAISYGQATETPAKTYKFYTGLGLLGNYSSTSTAFSANKNIQIAFAPFFGYAIKSFVIGTSIEYSYSKEESSSTYIFYSSNSTTSESRVVALNPKIRYYSPFGLFLDAGYYYGKTNNYMVAFGTTSGYNIGGSFGNYTANSTGVVRGPSASIGWAIKAGNHFLIEPLVNGGYLLIDDDKIGFKDYNTFILSAGIGFTLRF